MNKFTVYSVVIENNTINIDRNFGVQHYEHIYHNVSRSSLVRLTNYINRHMHHNHIYLWTTLNGIQVYYNHNAFLVDQSIGM